MVGQKEELAAVVAATQAKDRENERLWHQVKQVRGAHTALGQPGVLKRVAAPRSSRAGAEGICGKAYQALWWDCGHHSMTAGVETVGSW